MIISRVIPVAASPLVKRLVEVLLATIEEAGLQPGDRMPPVRQLAQQHGVSFRTMLLAVGHLEEAGVLERHQGSGTYITQRRQPPTEVATSTAVYVLVDSAPEIYAVLLEPVVRRLQAMGLMVVPVDCRTVGSQELSLDHVVGQWKAQPPRALIVRGNDRLTRAFVSRHCPPQTQVVCCYGWTLGQHERWDRVMPDEQLAHRMAFAHLIACGHQRIALIAPRRSGGRHIVASHAARLMHFDGAVEAYRDAGLSRGLMRYHPTPTPDDHFATGNDSDNVRRLAAFLSRPNRPTGIVLKTWRLPGLRRAVESAGLSFERDFQIVAVGDPNVALRGEVDCVSEEHELIARYATELILHPPSPDNLRPRTIIVPPRFVPVRRPTPAPDDSNRLSR